MSNSVHVPAAFNGILGALDMHSNRSTQLPALRLALMPVALGRGQNLGLVVVIIPILLRSASRTRGHESCRLLRLGWQTLWRFILMTL
jgi:hypothetical protein